MVLMADEHNKNNQDEQVVSTNNGGNNSNKGSSTNLEENVAALLCYLGSFVTGIIFIIIEKNSKFVRFHAMQSIVFFGGLVVINFIVGFLPFSTILSGLITLFTFIMWIVFMVKAYQKEYFKFPVTGQVAEDFVNKQN